MKSWYRLIEFPKTKVLHSLTIGKIYRVYTGGWFMKEYLICVYEDNGKVGSNINLDCFEELDPRYSQILEMFHNIK